MKVLVAEDDPYARLLLATQLATWGYEPVAAVDGLAAWDVLQRDDAPPLAVLDRMMPGMDGLEVCRRARKRPDAGPLYIILLTMFSERQDTIDGLEAGADDYVPKAFHAGELRARMEVGVRVVTLELELAARIADLEQALSRVDTLHGILTICAYCKKVRDPGNSWQQVEAYVSAHSAVRFSHGVCPGCAETVMQPQLDEIKRTRRGRNGSEP